MPNAIDNKKLSRAIELLEGIKKYLALLDALQSNRVIVGLMLKDKRSGEKHDIQVGVEDEENFKKTAISATKRAINHYANLVQSELGINITITDKKNEGNNGNTECPEDDIPF